MSSDTRYEVLTWDMNRQAFTPHKGVRRGPYSKFGLRKALRKLRDLGYDINRRSAFSVWVEQR